MSKKSILKARGILGIMLLTVAILFFNGFLTPVRSDELWDAFGDLDEWYTPASHDVGGNIIGLNDIAFETQVLLAHETTSVQRERPRRLLPTPEYLEQLMDFNYLTRSIFLVDRDTVLLPTDIDVPAFLEKDLTIDTHVEGPQVLIFHVHSMEEFIDSDPNDPMSGIMGVGRYLAEVLSEVHGIEVMHYTGRFDVVNGISHRPGSYERMEPVIRQILEDNPSIQMVIDLHRDGIPETSPPLITYIDGKRTAQIMFFNGLSRRYRNGQITNLDWLHNPYQRENLALSFNLQLAANQLYPGIARRIYLREFRYSLHMMPLSTLIEVGAQNNTKQEALNAMHPLANIIAAVILGED
ncbi:MAG: stage II sporulation protein P [Defluviitaleaceae bacterium]|nr:stage II sporulation protein P [Defluviitaleaceae bacterium]